MTTPTQELRALLTECRAHIGVASNPGNVYEAVCNKIDAFLARLGTELVVVARPTNSPKLDWSNPDDCLRWALVGIDLVKNKLLSMGSTANDTELINLRSAFTSIEAARAALSAADQEASRDR